MTAASRHLREGAFASLLATGRSVERAGAATLLALGLIGCGPASPRPGSAAGAAVRLAEGADFRRVVPGVAGSTAFALEPGRDERVGRLTYLRRAAEPLQLSKTADIESVRISPAVSPAAIFVEPASEASPAGQLVWVDLVLREPATTKVSGASRVSPAATWWGANGRQLLFVATASDEEATGTLHWFDGKNPVVLATGVPSDSVVVAASRGRAYALAELDEATGLGVLVSIELATGKVVRPGLQLFAADPSGAAPLAVVEGGVVGTDGEGRLVRVSSAGGRPTVLSEVGRSAVASGDGRVVAFRSAEGLAVWSGEGVTLLDTQAADVPARLSRAGDRIAWLREVTWHDGLAMGSLYWGRRASTAEAYSSLSLGENAALADLRFGLDQDRTLALVDRLSPGGRPDPSAAGRLVVAQQGSDGVVRVEAPGQGVRSRDVVELPEADSWAFLESRSLGALDAELHAVLPGVGRWTLATGAAPGSLLGAAAFDALAWREPSTGCVGLSSAGTECRFLVGPLLGATPGRSVQRLLEAVTDVAWGRDGRLLAVVPSGDAAGVWSLPAP